MNTEKPNEFNTLSFYPKFFNMEEYERDAEIEKYRAWLDQHGRYGNLYMMDIGPVSALNNNGRSVIRGVRIYKSDIAILFMLQFEL